MMKNITSTGWTKFKQEKGSDISDVDIRAAFKLVDVDKSGEISKIVKNTLKNIMSLSFLGVKNGLQISWKAIWCARCTSN